MTRGFVNVRPVLPRRERPLDDAATRRSPATADEAAHQLRATAPREPELQERRRGITPTKKTLG